MRSWLWTVAVVATMSVAHAAEPVSLGFVEFPADVKLGAMSAAAIDPQDNVYILHRGEPPLLAFDAAGKYVRGWGTGLFKVPHGLRLDRDGHLWTTDNGNHVLRQFDTEGKLLQTLGVEGQGKTGADGFKSPDDVVFDSQGNFYVADAGNGRIAKLDPTGKFVMQWGKKGKAPGEFSTAHSLAIDAQDRIYVGDRGNQRVQVFTSGGEHLADYTGFGNAFGLTFWGDELIASEGDKHQLIHLNRDGKILQTWGTPEALKLPHLMAVNSKGVLYVAEVNGPRVQMFRRAP
ncbi:MAG: peptidyl-alpha-hydroxyglycine alpha-amidating lyase family protein [Planctomycetaceae bacterium]|nr:peptidyl-alpha-hydroxyglycine alpha-amidating lyase family protein [Planctomycetaceae bacterium]